MEKEISAAVERRTVVREKWEVLEEEREKWQGSQPVTTPHPLRLPLASMAEKEERRPRRKEAALAVSRQDSLVSWRQSTQVSQP